MSREREDKMNMMVDTIHFMTIEFSVTSYLNNETKETEEMGDEIINRKKIKVCV